MSDLDTREKINLARANLESLREQTLSTLRRIDEELKRLDEAEKEAKEKR